MRTTYVTVTVLGMGCGDEQRSPGFMEASSLVGKTGNIQAHDSANVKCYGKEKAREGA